MFNIKCLSNRIRRAVWKIRVLMKSRNIYNSIFTIINSNNYNIIFTWYFNRRPNEANIIVDDAVMFKYSKKKWTTASSKSYSNYNWDKFKIYSNNTYIGKNLFSLLMVSGMYLRKIGMRLMYLEISYI